MNHDETNSNLNPEMRTWIDPELEARVVAWVAGEASAFESAELERLVTEKPELAIFKRRIEAVHGLVAEAARPDVEPLRLSEERRAKLLATIGAPRAAEESKTVVVMPAAKPARRRWTWRTPQIYFAVSGMAAAVMVGLFLAPSQFGDYKQATAREHAVDDKEASKARVERMTMVPSDSPEADKFAEKSVVFDAAVSAPPSVPQPQPLRLMSGTPLSDMAERNTALADIKKTLGASAATDAVADPIVKMDAFTVSEAREGNAMAIASSRAAPTPITVPGLSDGLLFKDKAALTLGASSTSSGDLFFSSGATVGGAGGKLLEGEPAVVTVPGAPNLSRKIGQTSDALPASRLSGFDDRGVVSGIVTVTNVPQNEQSQRQRINQIDASAVAGAVASTAPEAGPALFGSQLNDGNLQRNYVAGRATSMTLSDRAEKNSPKQIGAVGGMIATNAPVPGGSANEARPATEETITLSPFTVSSEKAKGSRDRQVAIDADRKSRVDALALRKPAELKEEQEKRPFAPASPAVPAKPAEEISAAKEAVSTFSLHVSDVSFRLAVAATAAFERGENPKQIEVRPEEFYNAFDYGDPATAVNEKIGARIEQSAHPVLQQRNLVRIALKVPATGRGAGKPLRLTILLDTSGSMEREDRRLAVRRALEELIALLGPNDRVTLIGFARQPRLLAENVAGNQAGTLVELSARTPAEGGTNLEAALKLAGELAVRHRLETAQNRIVMLTDGAANLGNADPERLAKSVEALRQQGIAFDACGIGLEGVGDAVLEALTRKGDGRYYVVDRPEAADAAFARQLAGAFRPAAENVKLQVRFNPDRVGNYRLIGFEQHRLKEEDFRNDKVDAAELAADEGANALYQVEVLPQGSGELGEVFVRFRDAASGVMVERSWTIRYDPQAPRFDRATPSLQLAGVAALLADKFNDAPLADQFKLGDFAGVVNTIRTHYSREPRVQELVTMYGRLRRITGE